MEITCSDILGFILLQALSSPVLSPPPQRTERLRQTLSHLSERTDDEIFQTKFSLRNAQLVIAREYGFERWADLKRHVESRRATETMCIFTLNG